MIALRNVATLLIVFAFALAPPAAAGAPRLENAITAGRLVEYDLTIEMTRDRRGPTGWTQVSDRQTGHLVRYNLSASDAEAQRIEMLILSPAAVVSATRDGVGVTPRPTPTELHLDAGGDYMTVNPITALNAHTLVPDGDNDRLIGVALLMATPQWPTSPTTQWTSTVSLHGNEIAVTWHVGADTPKTTGDTVTLRSAIDESADVSPGDAHAMTIHSTLVWDTAAGVASSLNGTARYRVSKPQFDESYSVHVVMTRRRLEDLSPAGQRDMHDAVLALNTAIAANRRGDREAAERDARAFVERWPISPWRPIMDRLLADLASGTAASSAPPAATQPAALLARLSQAMQSWQEADRAADDTTRHQLRTSLIPLVSASREEVRTMLKSDEPGPRAVGAFALAFTDDGLDLLALQDVTGDVDGRVRAWAAYALAIRADPRTEFRALQLLARDDDANVRARACEAVAACVPQDSRESRAARSLLLERLHDDFDGVRFHAAIALMSLAEPADLPQIEAVRKVEPSETVSDALDRLMKQLSPSD